ncbi:MAG: transketolase, partial [Frankiales bacterium]|nr:transketolase [Frankiales bacterium]
HISIEDDTDIAFTEDVLKRYESYGWHVQRVDWTRTGEYKEDVQELHAALLAAKAETSKPSIVSLRTIIGYPAPKKQNTGKIHGSALGAEEVAALKEILGFDPERSFQVDEDVLAHARQVAERGAAARREWQSAFEAWQAGNPEGAALLERVQARKLPAEIDAALPVFAAGKDVSTRAASGKVLNAIGPVMPELWGGSADLAESNNTTPKGAPSFLPSDRQSKEFQGGPYGRVLHFGVREHAMGAVMNGITLHGGTRVYGGTFLVFSDYMRGAVRLAALMQLPVTYVWTHDSIGLGEDGPTHQPVEHLAALRAIPGLDVVRPADANETVVAWKTVLGHTDRPAALALTRQNVPVFDRSVLASAEGVARGAYILAEASDGQPQVLIMATGSEVQIALAARDRLEAEGTATRVVSVPCVEWFRAQDTAYRNTVLPPDVKARVSIEAAVAQSWWEFLGDAGVPLSLEHFGASAPYTVVYEQFGLTAERAVAAAHASMSKLGLTKGSTTGN